MTSSQSPSLWQVEDAGPQHSSQIRALFESIFKEEMSSAHWQWKYGDGRGVGVVVRHNDEVIAFFGGTERRVLFNGESLCAIQCGDSMVAETHRGTLSKKGPFYLSVTSFLGQFVGQGLTYLLSYGFPNARAMRLAERLGMYEEVGTLLDVSWSPQNSPIFDFSSFDFGLDEHRQILDRLWQAMAAEFTDRSIGIRDLAYIRHRFHEHPSLDYNLHLVSLAGDSETIGLLITREVESRLLLVDVVGETQNFHRLVEAGRHLAFEKGCNDLYGWLTEVDYSLIANTDVITGEKPLRLPLGVYSPGLKASEVQDKWFFMCGDSDYL